MEFDNTMPLDILVDENWTIKLADFGFAKIKQENNAMSRYYNPCYTGTEYAKHSKLN